MIKYQSYLHYKLPITINPLNYGKLLEQFDNKYIMQLTTSNIVIIKENENENFVKLFRKGVLIFEYKDAKISENTFDRFIADQKYTFTDNKLVSTSILAVSSYIMFYNSSVINYKDTNSVLSKNITPFIHNTNYIQKRSFSTSSIIKKENIIKLRKRQSIHIWNTIEFTLNNLLFTKDIFESKLNLFWDKASLGFTESNHMFILFKVKYKGSDYATIGNLQKLNHDDKDWYLDWIINNMINKSEYYNETVIESFIFSYGFKNEKLSEKAKINTNVISQEYKNNKLIISYNPLDFGNLISENKIENYIEFILQTTENLIVKINKFEKYNEGSLISGGKTILNFRDEWVSENKFIRIIDNKKFYFENNKEILFTKEIKTKFISKLSLTKNLKNEFITLDVETFIQDSILIVYCISIFDGKKKFSFFLNDYKNVDDLIITALKSIMIRKYNGYNVYIHNMAKFDIIFLLKYLVKLGSVQPIIHNQRIITIGFNFGPNNKYQLQFKDSYLLLLHSLNKLCKSFNVENPKTIFPIFFVNENNLDYIGKVPSINYFKDILLEDYENYRAKFNNSWNLKNEAIKYCNLDCISLHQIITKFTEMIFDLFEKNVHNYPTLPSLAFAIFRSKFMKEENIPQLSGKISNDIRQGYTGGSCDVFIPKSKQGVKVKCYDVNSLYPSQMQECDMPIGTPTYFIGDITTVDQNAFGFFYCEIIAPDNIKHPILQTHVKTANGIRTISPVGTWEDMIFSKEMNNAKKYDYKFNVLWGYTFKKDNIFKDYVDFLYTLRSQYPKSNPFNFIAKILMNSLYGRFGMDDNFSEISIIHKDYIRDFENKFFESISGRTEMDDYIMIECKNLEENIENENSTHNINVAFAAAITAYSRIHMSIFKNNPKINLYYTDTDSIYTDSDINDSFIDSKILGKLKLEHTCDKAIFLSPKVYCLDTENNGVIYKVKGLKHEIELTMNDYENLLVKNNFIEKTQSKWFRNLSDGHISILEHMYTLKVTDNKRKLIYDKNHHFISTEAYKINKAKTIINN